MIHVIFWPLFCALIAAAQGLLMPAIRRTPPSDEAGRQSFALHFLFTIAYFLPVLLCPPSVLLWKWALAAFATRVAVFDIVLNYWAGDVVLAVGQTAASDKFLRRLSPTHPERLSGILKAGIAALAILFLFLH